MKIMNKKTVELEKKINLLTMKKINVFITVEKIYSC